ncbi:hypothetical protein [Streptomyces sp. NPDC007984]|uniref:hypothetical protein n=1 Tax=Streptomyces sp. NPDC007984 TaxID=3364801 RepID=UPI0036EED73C
MTLGVRERLRQAGWTHVITVCGAALAALAAIGGLWAQAVASYWTQQTAKDQLSQSSEDSEREAQDQASRITYWLEYPEPLKAPVLHILNRSLDPVTNVTLVFSRIPGELYVGAVRDLPPCTEDVFNSGDMTLMSWPKKEQRKLWDSYRTPPSLFTYLSFVDSNGAAWERSPTDLRAVLPPDVRSVLPPEASSYLPAETDPAGFLILGNPRVHKTDICGDEHK